MKPVTLSCRFKKDIWIKIVENRMLWKARKKLKLLDRSNAIEILTKILYGLFSRFFLPFTENSMKRVTISCPFKEGIWIKFVENRKIWKERKKLKYFDRSNANEMMTKNLYERCSSYFLPFTENSMKRVTFSCPFKEGIWKKLVGNRRIWNERKKLK